MTRAKSKPAHLFGKKRSVQLGTVAPINGFRSGSIPKSSDLKQLKFVGDKYVTLEPKTLKEKVHERKLSQG
jgi:hypothetical protein